MKSKMAAWVARLWLVMDVCLQVYGSYSPEPPIVVMDDRCGQVFEVRNQFLLRLTDKGKNYRSTWNCDLRLQAKSEYHLVIKFKSVNIHTYSSSCRDYVQILDGFDSNADTLTGIICNNRSYPTSELTTTNEKASVWFKSDSYGMDKGFEILITPSNSQPEIAENAIFIGIAVATSVLLLTVAIGMCCCVYCNRKKQLERRRRRQARRETLQLQMTLELTGITNPTGPPPTPDVTAPAYSPPCPPPPYSTLPRRHAHKDDTVTDTETGENPQTGEVTPEHSEHPPPYEEHL